MATVQVTEYASLAEDAQGYKVAAGMEPHIASQAVSYTTSTASNALNKDTRFLLITTDGTKAHFAVGTSPTATAADPQVAANGALFIGIRPGSARLGTLKIAFYDGTTP